MVEEGENLVSEDAPYLNINLEFTATCFKDGKEIAAMMNHFSRRYNQIANDMWLLGSFK